MAGVFHVRQPNAEPIHAFDHVNIPPDKKTALPDYERLDADVRLMIEVRADNAAAFETLVARYQQRLLTVLELLVGSPDLAEDLTQEVFLRVFRARKRYEPKARFSTWLFTIANNVASNARRARAYRREISIGNDENRRSAESLDELLAEASGLMPTRQLDKAETITLVRGALELLNERQRLALLLSKFEGLSYDDIAVSMGVTSEAVKSLLARARGNLRKSLEPYILNGSLGAIAKSG